MSAPSILVIDDDPLNRDMLRTRLARAGYEVREASHGEEGLSMASQRVPDLIILDVMMPRLDGWQVCRRLKAELATKDVPVVMLTARSQRLEAMRGLECGADEYLSKPCDHQGLLDLIARLLGARGGGER